MSTQTLVFPLLGWLRLLHRGCCCQQASPVQPLTWSVQRRHAAVMNLSAKHGHLHDVGKVLPTLPTSGVLDSHMCGWPTILQVTQCTS